MADDDSGAVEDDAAAGIDELDEDVYNLLGDKRRRYTVHYLKQHDDTVSVRDLAEQVAAWENRKDPQELTSQERKRVYISLYQSHLPTLAAEGLVHYDKDRGSVRPASVLHDYHIYMEVVPAGSIPWSHFYLGLAAVGAVLLGLVWYDLYPFSELPDLAWAGLIVAALAITAAVNVYQTRQKRLGADGPPPTRDDFEPTEAE